MFRMLADRNTLVSIAQLKVNKICAGPTESNLSSTKQINFVFPFEPVASREDLDDLEKRSVVKEFVLECCSVTQTVCGFKMAMHDIFLNIVDMLVGR